MCGNVIDKKDTNYIQLIYRKSRVVLSMQRSPYIISSSSTRNLCNCSAAIEPGEKRNVLLIDTDRILCVNIADAWRKSLIQSHSCIDTYMHVETASKLVPKTYMHDKSETHAFNLSGHTWCVSVSAYNSQHTHHRLDVVGCLDSFSNFAFIVYPDIYEYIHIYNIIVIDSRVPLADTHTHTLNMHTRIAYIRYIRAREYISKGPPFQCTNKSLPPRSLL